MDFWSTRIISLLLTWGSVRAQQAFMVEPRNQTVRMGSTAVLRCGVLRAAGPVQWLKDGLLLGPQRGLPGFPRYSMVGNPSRGQFNLQVERAELDDDGPYECQVGGTESSQPISSDVAWLDVLIPPSEPYFEVDRAEPWVAGSRYVVVCIAPDAKPEATIQMFKAGVELLGGESLTMAGSKEKLWNTRTEVTVLAHSSDDGSLLTCLAKNAAANKPTETTLTMRVYFPPQPPVIRGLEVGEEVRGGSQLRLVCVSPGGNPLAGLHWMKDGELVSTSWQEDLEARLSSSTLHLRVSPADNQAEFSCLSLNLAMTSPLEVSRKVTVLFEPAEVGVLGSYEVVEGSPVTLSCVSSSSNPPVSIRWWLGSRELNASTVSVLEGEHGGSRTTSNLTHLASRHEDGLPLTCEVFNPGTRFSRSVTENLAVFYPPLRVWLTAPPPQPLRSGTKVRMVCFSTGGSPRAVLTWLKNGRPVSGALGPRPFDKGVSRELPLVLGPGDNMAAYSCDAQNEAGRLVSAETKLQVLFTAVSMKITAQQETLRAGQTLDLQCLSGSSNPKADVSWSLGALRFPGEEQPPRRAVFGGVSVSSTLSLPLVPHYNKQRLVCQAYSPLLSEGANSFYTLDVLYPPEFSPRQPKLIQVTEDYTATIPLLVSANPEDVTCTWLHRQQKLIRDRDIRLDGSQENSLEIRNVSRRHGGRYTVQCANDEGLTQTFITLDVQYSPGVRPRSSVVQVDLGGTADLICVADANPAASFSWSWLGEGEMELEVGAEEAEEEFGVLTIQEVTRGHAGRYQCTADNGIAPPASAEVELVVCFKPEIQKGVQWSKVASRGDGSADAQLVCRAESIPDVSFSWDKNNVPLDLGNPRYMEQTVRDGSFYTSTLVVVNVSATLDYTEFTCHASNALGEDWLSIQLVSTNRPDPPSSLGLVEVTHDSVTLEWIPGFNGGLDQRFRVRYRGPLGESFTYVDVFPLHTAMYTVSGLAPLTTYTFSLNALNAIGESGYADDGAQLSVTTRERFEEEAEEDEGAPGLPLYLTTTLAAVAAGVLLALNSLGCLLGWRRRSSRVQTGRRSASHQSSVLDEKKSEAGSRGSTGGSSGRYQSREEIDAAARQTLVADPGSDTQSHVYESYGESHHYYPSQHYLLPLQPYPEKVHRPDRVHYPVHHAAEPPGHEYEAVREIGWSQDVAEPPSSCQPPDYPQGSRGLRRTPDNGLTQRDYDLPFELRGELV